MKIVIVKKPLQDEHTEPEKLEYFDGVAPHWCVDTFIYRQGDLGMAKWFLHLEAKKPDVVYLYEIRAKQDRLVTGPNPGDWVDEIFYFVRAALKYNQ